MKANLPQSEPKRLAAWEQERIYEQIRAERQDAPSYVLHDGPPYANGPIHLGHALNKCLKDFVVKSKTMAGFNAPYVPGWDCHGLPIEIKVDEKLGRKKLEMPAIAVRRACREYAQKYLDLQRTQFQRLGIFGRWGLPYSTMTPEYESKIIETFFQFLEKGFVYKGLKPVLWCMHDRTALAEAEVEYDMHTSPSVYVRYRLTSPPEAIDVRLAGKQVSTIIWTTTPWTLPASLAVAFHPDFEYVALEQDGEVYIVAEALAAATRAACGLETCAGDRSFSRFADGARYLRSPFPRSDDAGRSGHLRHHRPGHRRRPHRARAWRGRLCHRRTLWAEPAMRRGRWRAPTQRAARIRRALRLQSQRPHHRPAGGTWRPDGAAGDPSLLPALLALPPAGDLPGHRAVVYQHGNAHGLTRTVRSPPSASGRWRRSTG